MEANLNSFCSDFMNVCKYAYANNNHCYWDGHEIYYVPCSAETVEEYPHSSIKRFYVDNKNVLYMRWRHDDPYSCPIFYSPSSKDEDYLNSF